MSSTRTRTRLRVQEMLRDMNPDKALVPAHYYDEVIERNMYLIAGRVFVTPTEATSISLLSGTSEYTLTDTQVQSVTMVLLNSDGRELTFVPWEEFNARYKQDSADPLASGKPREYTLREKANNPTHDCLVRFGPTPNASDTAKLHLSQLPSVGTPAPSYLSTSDSTAAPYADDLMRALQAACAGEIASVVAPEKLVERGLSPNCGRVWLGQVSGGVRSYNQRARQLVNAGHVLRPSRAGSLAARY